LVTITATLGTAFGGLGFFILEGYSRAFPTEILAGAVPSIILAILVDVAFVRVQHRLTPWAAGHDGPTRGSMAQAPGAGG
ncbi:MAG: hypothetical protein ACRDGQ_03545, partial [Candidatus Limnocylindrales bacterium]